MSKGNIVSIDAGRGSRFDQLNMRDNAGMHARVIQRTPVSQSVQKSSTVTGAVQSFSFADQSFADFLRGRGHSSLSTYQALRYYAEGSVVFDAVDEISSKGSPIEPVLWDKQNQEYVKEHPLLTLLRKPNGDSRGKQFRTGWLVYWLVTGNVPVMASSLNGGDPLELWLYAPYCLNLKKARDGSLGQIDVTVDDGSIVLRRDANDNFVGGPGGIYQMLLSREFNPFAAKQGMWGMSKLSPLFYEIEQLMSINVHNNSLLKRGATPSMLFSAQGSLTDEQFARLKEQIELYYSGAANAGRPMLGENGMDVKSLTTSNKDMDYKGLTDTLATRCYNIFNVPLPSISTSAQTYSNYETSRLRLYDEAILPVVQEMFDELASLLVPRYRDLQSTGGLNRYMLTYDENEIPALEARRIENLVRVNKTGVTSTNEQRVDYLAKEEVEGGDEILTNAGLVPLSTVKRGADNDEVRTDDQPDAVATADPNVEDVQQQALNGAQIGSLQEIVQAVADGTLPPESAIGMVLVSFPTMTEAQAQAIINPAAEFAQNKPAPVTQSAPTPPPAAPEDDEEELSDDEKARAKYVDILKQYRHPGSEERLYSDEDVELLADKHFKRAGEDNAE